MGVVGYQPSVLATDGATKWGVWGYQQDWLAIYLYVLFYVVSWFLAFSLYIRYISRLLWVVSWFLAFILYIHYISC
jgi:hypothetical protein